ncbi:MAG TPA: hypothetical protein PK977_11555, partial [Chitinophagaceae bacterium]|nr:hypothetical protein [Chitinophagaceae bacterium]
MLLSQVSVAQRKVTLEEVLKMATEKNLSLQSARMETGYWKQLQSGVFDPAKTVIGTEYGNINSFNNDNRFFISQTFGMPVVYRRQKDWYLSNEIAQQQMVNWKEAELRREVKKVFY